MIEDCLTRSVSKYWLVYAENHEKCGIHAFWSTKNHKISTIKELAAAAFGSDMKIKQVTKCCEGFYKLHRRVFSEYFELLEEVQIICE